MAATITIAYQSPMAATITIPIQSPRFEPLPYVQFNENEILIPTYLLVKQPCTIPKDITPIMDIHPGDDVEPVVAAETPQRNSLAKHNYLPDSN
ncbi:hypothetical protein M0802_012734 [Mischocyttarus mexicanus]|nr:hypothetical protein M0802_012734 [Mischocyttarus mexicanus]